MEKSRNRLEVLKKIEKYEQLGLFDQDVENDPPADIIMPKDVDYLCKKISSKIKNKIAYSCARKFVNNLLKDEKLIIKNIVGIENLKNISSGAIITCNHFNPFDCFAMQYVFERAGYKKKKLYKVIREGNYTSFRGLYGMLFKNCDTLPLSSNSRTMVNMINATNKLLQEGNFVLIYPEQSMWWNYRKPKPLKNGAFKFAVNNSVPIIPCFITMQDTHNVGEDGFPIQAYTINILKPIYPNKNVVDKEAVEKMKNENYQAWKECYQSFYKKELIYSCKTLPNYV